jgi:hypothetical protein
MQMTGLEVRSGSHKLYWHLRNPAKPQLIIRSGRRTDLADVQVRLGGPSLAHRWEPAHLTESCHYRKQEPSAAITVNEASDAAFEWK